jgi:hypothetical protein
VPAPATLGLSGPALALMTVMAGLRRRVPRDGVRRPRLRCYVAPRAARSAQPRSAEDLQHRRVQALRGHGAGGWRAWSCRASKSWRPRWVASLGDRHPRCRGAV